MNRARLTTLATAVVSSLLLPSIAAACSVCYGDPNDPMTQGMNMAIFTLLGCVSLLYAGFIRLFWGIYRRSRAAAAQSTSVSPGGTH